MKKYYEKQAITLVLLSILYFPVSGLTLHLKPGPIDGKDVFIASNSPNANYNNHEEFAGEAWTCGVVACNGRGLLKFDLSSIPQGSTVFQARISLFANPNPVNCGGIAMQGNNQCYLQRITNRWDENTVTWNNCPTTTTNNEVNLVKSINSLENYLNIDVTLLVQDMIDDTANSFGFLLGLTNEISYASMIFASSNYPDSTLWPEITIEYGNGTCLQNIIDASGSDAYLSSSSPTTNFGNHEELSSIAWTCSGDTCIGRGLFNFNLNLPPHVQIINAYLDLFANLSPPNGGGIAMQGNNASIIQRVTSNWSENTVTWQTMPTVTTQNQVFLPQSVTNFQNYFGIDLTSLVQDAYMDSTHSFGFMIRLQNETPYTSMIFASGDYPDPNLHPKIKVCYVPLTGIDELSNSITEMQVFPNPFDDQFKMNFNLKTISDIKIQLFDMYGRCVLADDKGKLSPGYHTFEINSINNKLADAIYFLRVQAIDGIVVRKIIKN